MFGAMDLGIADDGQRSLASSVRSLARPLLPFLAAIVAVLLLLAFVPEIVLYLPRALGFTR
jgi:TRAP-type C4-dicarboxylate transport system permease large subunit